MRSYLFDSDCYVYTLFKPDGTVFYVGQGRGNRMLQHEDEARRGHDCPKCETIRSIWHEGGKVGRKKVAEHLTRKDATDLERRLIYEHGLQHLVNRFPGRPGRKTDRATCEFRAHPLDYQDTHGRTLHIRRLPVSVVRALEKRANESGMECEDWLLTKIVDLSQTAAIRRDMEPIDIEETAEEVAEVVYTIKGYAADHSQWATIRNDNGDVSWHSDGFEYRSREWQILEHAVDLVQRGTLGDKEEAVQLFAQLFGARNVFVKDGAEL